MTDFQTAYQEYLKGNYQESAKMAKVLLPSDPESINLLHLLIANYHKLNIPDKSKFYLTKALKIDNDQPELRYSNGMIQLLNGNFVRSTDFEGAN